MTTVLEVRNGSKSFPGVKALDDVSIEIARNEVVGLIGENGAGKSTLLKIITGIYQLDEGELIVNSRTLALKSPRDAFDHGVAMVFQEQSVLPTLTIAENIFLGREQEFLRFGLIDRKRMNAAARDELAKVHLDLDPATRTADLTFGQRQMVEIAKALSLDSRIEGEVIILLDEPTSVLEQREIDLLFAIIADLKQRASILFISHRLDEVLRVSDRVYVMRDGRVVHEVASADAKIHDLHQHMVGRQLDHRYYREQRQVAADERVLLKVEGLTRTGAFNDIAFKLHAGEILGIAGVVGSGREALARCLAGLEPAESGDIEVGGASVRIAAPHQAVAAGIGFVPSERKVEGIVAALDVSENMSLAAKDRFLRHGLIDFAAERETATTWVRRLGVKTPSIRTPGGSLSGGNQQKVVLAKWRIAGSDVMILDHPTRGIDVGAKEEVYELIRDMAAEGLGILLLADTLEEVIGLSSRILVMKDGRISRTFEAPVGAKPEQIDLIEAMV
ncbi:MAG: sugar ABC transporter ATP-binding protein [Alphaproteobacteria bacterium]